METKNKIRRSRSLSDILKVCIPHIVEKENKEMCKDEEKSVKATDCNGNEQKTVSLGIKELYEKNATSTTNNVAMAASPHVNNNRSKALITVTGPHKKKPSRKSYRQKRRATVADLSCIDILNPIPEMQEEEDEFNAISKDSKVNQNDIGKQPRHVDDESGSGQRQSWRDGVRKEMQQWRDDFEKLRHPENNHNDIRSHNGANGESFELCIKPSKREKSDPNRADLNIEEQDAQNGSDEDNDEDVESLELKDALSNYEIAYDVDEDENTNIFERLEKSYKKNRQLSDSLSSLTTKSSGSERSSSSVSPVDEKLLHEKMQEVEVPKRRRRFSTSDLHLRCLLHALPLIREEGKKNSFSSSASSDSNDSIPTTDLMRRRSGSLPNILAFRQAIIIKQRNDTKVDGPQEAIDEEDDSSHKQQIKLEHREVTSLDQPQLPPNAAASKTSKRRNSISVIEDVRPKSLTDPASAQNGDLPDVPSSIEENVCILENGGTEGSIESRNLLKALGQKMKASIRRRNSVASLKPWTGIVERSLRLSFPLLIDGENEDGTKDKFKELKNKNINSEADYKLILSGHCKNEKKVNVSVVQGETLPYFQLHKDFTTSGIDNGLDSGLESQQSRNSAFTQQKKRYGADKEKDLKTVEQILEVVKNDHKKRNENLTGGELEAPAKTLSKSDGQDENNPPHLPANEMPQSKVSTFSRSRRSSMKEIQVSKPMKVLKSTSSQKATLPPESPKLENKRKVPVGRALSNPLPKTSPSVNRPSSPSAFYGKNQVMKQESLCSWSVKETLDKERPARTASSTRPPSPTAIVTKKYCTKQELPSSKGKADAKTPSNRPASPSTIARTNHGKKHEVATSNNSQGTLAKASLSRPASPLALTRKNQTIKQDSSFPKSAKGTTPAKETPPKTPLNRPPSPSAFDRKNRSTKEESSSQRNVKRTLDKEATPKTVSNRLPSPSAFTKSNHCTKQEFSSTSSGKGINESISLSKTPSKPSPQATAQASKRTSSPVTRKSNTKSPPVTRKASIRSEFNHKKEVTTNVPNTPKDQGASRKHSLISNMEKIPKDNSHKALAEGIAPNVEKSKTTNIVENLTSEEVPKKQVKNMEEKPIIERVRKEVKDRGTEKVKVTIADVSKVIPTTNIQEKPRERKTCVNVIRRPLSSSLVITIPDSPPEKDKEDPRKQDRHFISSGINQEEVSLAKKKEENPNALSLDNSTDKSRYQELGKKQTNVDQNLDQSIERELDSFGSLLEEFEQSSSFQNKSSTNNNNLEQKKAHDNNESKTSNDAIPTEKRFAALSERYDAIMSKFGMLNKAPSSERPTVATTSPTAVLSPLTDNKSSHTIGVSLAVSENINKARSSVLPLSEDRVSKIVSGLSVTEKNGMTLHKPKYKVKSRKVSLPESINTISKKEDCSPVLAEKSVGASIPVEPSLPPSENKATLPVVSEDNIRKDEVKWPVNEVNRVKTPVPDPGVRKGEVRIPYFENIVRKNGDSLQVSEDIKFSKHTTTASDIDLLHSSFDGKQTKTTLDTPFSEEKLKSSTPISMSELSTFGTHSTPSVPIICDDVAKLLPLSSRQDASYLSIISKFNKEKDQKKEKEGVDILKATLMKVEEKPIIPQGTKPYIKQNVLSLISSVEDPLTPTASHNDEETSALATEETFGALSENAKNSDELRRTTVIARLIDRKLGPKRKTSIVPTFAPRTSKVFGDSEEGIQGIPLTMGHFNRYRDRIEKVTLKSTVRTEALSIHDILNSLDTSLMEMELVSLCKECTKTLRTLDALGSLPSYLSPNTIIVNPSGTIKFRHLSTDVTIDELFLAPEHTKKFSSEKTCVFSLAVTIWLAADWKLTEHKKPALSRKFQELLFSMTTDSSKERANLDSILQTCDSLHTDNEMTSREHCQALLWECQATKDLGKLNVDKKAIAESEKTKAQHAILMGSVSVAANVKGFLKQAQAPAEGKLVQDTKPRDTINKSLETEPQRKSSIEQEIDHNKVKQTNPKVPSPAGNMFSHYHNPADPSMMFTPISGHPNPNQQSSFPGGQSQTSTPTFFPIAVPVPTAGTPPMWYMTPSGMVPFGPMGHHPGYFVPVNQGSASSVVSDSEISGIYEMAHKEISRNSRPSTPMSETSHGSSASKTTRSVTPSTKSKIPRLIRDPNSRSPRPPNSHKARDSQAKSFTTTGPCERFQVRKGVKEEIDISSIKESFRSTHENSTEASSYRSHTPPIRLRSGSVELEREELRRPRPRSSTGSLVSTPSSGERTSRPPSPVTYGNRSERSRPSSPSFSEGRPGSRSSSPVGSRSSSPVAALISRFEDLSTKEQPSEHSQSVSNLLSKFGSSSLLPDDLFTKKQFKANTPQSKDRDYYGRAGPFKPTSAADKYSNALLTDTDEALSKSSPAKPTQKRSSQNYAPSLNSVDSPTSRRNLRNKETSSNRQRTQSSGSGLLVKDRNRLALSLENIYGVSCEAEERQTKEQYSMVRNRERSWASMENVHKPSNEEQIVGYRIRTSSSAENLLGVASDKSQGLRKLLEESLYAKDRGIDKDKLALSKKLSPERTGQEFWNKTIPIMNADNTQPEYLTDKKSVSNSLKHDQELNIGNRDTTKESVFKSNVMKPERDYQQDYPKELISPSGRLRFEIPVAIAVMDGEREIMSSSAFAPSLFSPSSAIKDKTFFQHPIKLEKETAPLSPPVPLSPSVKDCRPTSYFSSLSFSDLAMKPEKDTAIDRNRKDDTEHHPRATSYQVDSDGVGVGHHDKQKKSDITELVDKNLNIENLGFSNTNSPRKNIDKGGSSSRNSLANSNDYLERFQKRLTKTNSLENIRQDTESQISLSYNKSKPKTFEENAPSTKPYFTIRESLGKLSADSLGNPVENVGTIRQGKGTLSSLDSQGFRGSRSSQTEAEGKRINNDRSPSDTGGKERSTSNDSQQRSRPPRVDESSGTPTQQQNSQTGSSASSKPLSVANTQGNPLTKPPAKKTSSVPNTPTSGSSKNSTFFSYTRRQSSPQVAPLSEEKSAKQDASSSSKLQDRKLTKQSFKPKSSAPSTNPRATSRNQHSTAAEQSTFDLSEKALIKKAVDNVTTGKQVNRNMRHETVVSSPVNVEHTLSKKTHDIETRTDSSDLISSKWGNVRQLVLRSPTSPTSSNSSTSSSSPRLPLNKSVFYLPQSERAEKQLSPTEQLNSSCRKGFIITDTSRQSKVKSDNTEKSDHLVYQKDSSSVNEKKERKKKNGTVENPNFKNPSAGAGLATKYDKTQPMKSEEKSSMTNKVVKLTTKEDSVSIVLDKKEITARAENQSSIITQPIIHNHNNINLRNEVVKNKEQGIEKKLEKSSRRNRHNSENLEEMKRSPASKESNAESVSQGEASGERRGSFDLRQIYNSARRASLTPRPDTGSPTLSPNSSTTSRPTSALDKRPPSPGRLDSKELLGHFVKKMLNSANASKPNGASPSSSFADGAPQQSREPLKTDVLGKYALSPRERRKTTGNMHQDRKESLERKEESAAGRRERKVYHERLQQHLDQERHDKTRGRKESYERKQQYENQGRIDAERERKRSHDRTQQKDNHRRNDAASRPKGSHEKEHQLDNQGRIDAERERKTSQERIKQKHEEREKTDPKTDKTISNDKEHLNERVEVAERRLSHEKDNEESLNTSGENEVLNKLVDMIHDEFAFDGYLDDGVEDVNMGEYVMSLSGMSEDMFKESVRDQYSDLYWDDDLLQDMYILVNRKLSSRRPTLRFSESIASDESRPGSSLSMDSNPDASHQATRSVSRTSSERSFLETRDYVMSSLGEPTQFLPFKMICPEITRDIIEELGPVFEDYQKEMKIKLAPSISELMENLGAKILEIGQQLTLERRAKKKNIASFKKIADVDNKRDVKDLTSKLLQEIEESDNRIIYLKYIQRRLRNIYAERFGLDHSLLYSFVSSYGIENVSLEPKRQNNLLSFSPLWDQRGNQSSEAHGESIRGPVLQYGTTQGLFSYLFARYSTSQAFVRFFLYTFRYCASPDELFDFIHDKCRASLRAETGSDKTYNHQLQIRYRALDLLAEWVDCCFQFDFKTNPGLLESLFAFLDKELIPVDKTERGKMLVELITEKQRKDEGEHIEGTTDTLAVLQTDDQGSVLEKESPKKFPIKRKKTPAQCFMRGSSQASSMYKPTVYLKAMSVIDRSSRTIAEQLTLIQQDVFAHAHSIHFLNSRTLGIGVGRLSPTKETTQLDSMLGFSAGRRRSISSETLNTDSLSPRTSGENSLFVCQPITDGCLEDLLMHAQDVSMWVAVEICSAPSVKNQLVLIQKYISVAKYCAEMRNFATSIQVVDALEMFVIRQLPVWKQVPNKVIQTLEELKAIKVLLKTDSSWLLKDNAYREKPTIPCALLFLMHIQQLELGGFTLTNGMYKWTKMRSIARLVDQIRLFKQMRYAFESNEALKDRLRMRIQECREENLHALAAENATNFHLTASQSSRKFQEAFKKMKATFGNG